jgi:hypothetical protein
MFSMIFQITAPKVPAIPALKVGLFLLSVFVLMAAGSVHAGVGSAASGVTTLDTRQPELTIALDPTGDLFQGGQWFQATVTTGDDHPGSAPQDHYLVAWVGESPVDTLEFDPLVQPALIDWQAPEISSAHVRLAAYSRDLFGNVGSATTADFTVIPSVTDVPAGPDRFRFGPGHPNPFNPVVDFSVDLPSDGRLRMKVYDARGRLIKTLAEGEWSAGSHRITWDGTTNRGIRSPGGTYLVASEFRRGSRTNRLIQKVMLLP